MEKTICQSCGMKMEHTDYGKNADGSPNKEYCKYCFPNGQFGKDETMEEVMKYLPTLKRWRK